MPIYEFYNKKTKEKEEHILQYKCLLDFLNENPNLERVFNPPTISSGIGDNLSKAGSGWNDLLKNIKNGSEDTNTIKTK